MNQQNHVLYIPHGGGPMPLFEHKGHLEMISFLKKIPSSIPTPSALIIISAHWEETEVTITSAKNPELFYDYSGFPKEAYDIKYPAPGNPDLAEKIQSMLNDKGINAQLNDRRGLDHGVFVPLKLMYPEANIPCIQISLVKGLDAKAHLLIGNALSALENDNILIIGSGMSFHNTRAFSSEVDEGNLAFEDWLIDTCTSPKLTEDERNKRLANWTNAPSALYCHPREEHLIPLHVCYGIAQSQGELVFDGKTIGKKTSAYLWKH